LLALERAEEILEASVPTVDITIPSASSITEFWPDIQHLVAVPQDLQRTITVPVRAIYVGFRLSQALLESCLTPDRRPNSLDNHEHLRPWALDVCRSLWESLRRWSTSADSNSIQGVLQAMYMEQLNSLAFPNPNAPDDFANSPKAALAIISGLLDMLQLSSTSAISEPNQIYLATLLARLRRVLVEASDSDLSENRRWRTLVHLIANSMEPDIVACCRNVAKLTSLHLDLQVWPHSHKFLYPPNFLSLHYVYGHHPAIGLPKSRS